MHVQHSSSDVRRGDPFGNAGLPDFRLSRKGHRQISAATCNARRSRWHDVHRKKQGDRVIGVTQREAVIRCSGGWLIEGCHYLRYAPGLARVLLPDRVRRARGWRATARGGRT